jgi:hypothetical protein
VRQNGFDRRTIAKWIRLDALPDRNASALKTSSPRYFEEYLSRRWAEGYVRGRQKPAATQEVFQTRAVASEMALPHTSSGSGLRRPSRLRAPPIRRLDG